MEWMDGDGCKGAEGAGLREGVGGKEGGWEKGWVGERGGLEGGKRDARWK